MSIVTNPGISAVDRFPCAETAALGRVVVVQGDGQGRSCVVRDELLIGRAETTGLCLADSEVSRRHLRIRRSGPRSFVLEDLGSRNGTAVNGQRCASGEHPLKFGDCIQLGKQTVLLFAHHDEREERIHQAQKLQSLGQLAGGIAHDINNLVGAALCNLEMVLANQPLQQSSRQCLEDSQNALTRVVEMVRRLLDFSRNAKLESRPVAFLALAENALKVLRHRSPHGVTCTVEIPPDLMVQGDATALLQVMTNLGANALDAMPGGGRLILTAQALTAPAMTGEEAELLGGAAFARLTIQDTGTGMTPDVLAHAFEPFFTTKPAGRGTGLGMAVVHGLVRNHGGHVRIQSQVGVGTAVTVYLPLAREQQTPGEIMAPSQDEWDGNTSKTLRGASCNKPIILVAEDEPILLRSTHRALAGMDAYQVITARDGDEAWQLFQAHADSIGVALLDVHMPGRSGLEVSYLIHAHRPGARVVLTSGVDGPYAHEPGQHGTAFLPKPYSQEQLRVAVLSAMLR